ncbi:hypothetical protein RHIZ_03840 [Rhizobium skierniewicense]|uniref:hypothetical protein n=1 Tax=Rhizobium skierniewicense TaxID=984260 RepID=UPI001FACB1BB|nr:hypothetical protein [Rhizobium skierniewicense]MCI9865073.1 hypothetical protein [Rhizobium skierniewicense]
MVYLQKYLDAKNARLADAHKNAPRIVRGEERKHVINRVMDEIKDWRLSPFENEGRTRHGLRVALCMNGHSWSRSDREADLLLQAVFHYIGAERPTWAQGQREYTEPLDNCNWCKGPLEEFQIDRRERFCGPACAKAAITYRTYQTNFNEDSMGRAAYRILQQAKTPPRACQQCGVSYHAIRAGSDQKFCSHRCRDRSMTTLPVKPCLYCETEFKPHDANSHYCSVKCRAVHRFQTARIEKPCACCDTPFVAKISIAKYCSKACKKRAFKARKKTATIIAFPQPLTAVVFDGWFRRAV